MSSDDREDDYKDFRPRPSRKKRRKKRVLGIFPRVMLVTFAIAFTVVMCTAFFSKLGQPYQMSHGQTQQMAALDAQLADVNNQNAALEHQATYLRRPDGIENEARAKGYLRPGEISLVIEMPAASAAPAAPPSGFADRMRRAWNHFVGK